MLVPLNLAILRIIWDYVPPCESSELRVGAKYPASIDDAGAADQWGVFDWDIGRTGNERRGRVCEACRRREEASWATTRE